MQTSVSFSEDGAVVGFSVGVVSGRGVGTGLGGGKVAEGTADVC